MSFIEQIIEVIEAQGDKFGRLSIAPEVWSEFNSLTPAQTIPAVARPIAKTFESSIVPVEKLEKALSTPGQIISGMHEIESEIKKCQRCCLADFRKNALIGAGPVPARLMMIAEAPSASDDDCGAIFSGEVGELLDKMIAAMKLSRSEIYMTSIVKCRPPGNRRLEVEEVEQCVNFLKSEIAMVKPEVIVSFGAGFSQYVLRRSGTISALRGIFDAYDGIPVMSTFSPAYLLRKTSAKREVWSDLQQVMKLLKLV